MSSDVMRIARVVLRFVWVPVASVGVPASRVSGSLVSTIIMHRAPHIRGMGTVAVRAVRRTTAAVSCTLQHYCAVISPVSCSML